MGDPQGLKTFFDNNSSLVGSGEVSKFFLKRKDACEGFNFLRDFEFRSHEGAGQAAAWSAAATVMPGYEVSKHAAAAFEDLGDFARAGAATAEEFSDDSGLYNLIFFARFAEFAWLGGGRCD